MDGARLASPEEVKEHLEAFIQVFVDPARRDRWRLFMLDKPDKAARELHTLQLDGQHATWLGRNERGSSPLLEAMKGKLGIYFTFKGSPVWMRMEDGALQSDWQGEDAIFSIVPGKLAVYFNHDYVSVVLQSE